MPSRSLGRHCNVRDTDRTISYDRYHGCYCWPGDAGKQSISSHDMDYNIQKHYSDVIMGAMERSNNRRLSFCSGAVQRKYRSSASLTFLRGIHRSPVNSPHKGPVTRKCFHLMTSSCFPIAAPEGLNMIGRHGYSLQCHMSGMAFQIIGRSSVYSKPCSF